MELVYELFFWFLCLCHFFVSLHWKLLVFPFLCMSTEELRSKWKKQLKKDTAGKLKSLVTAVTLQLSQILSTSSEFSWKYCFWIFGGWIFFWSWNALFLTMTPCSSIHNQNHIEPCRWPTPWFGSVTWCVLDLIFSLPVYWCNFLVNSLCFVFPRLLFHLNDLGRELTWLTFQ